MKENETPQQLTLLPRPTTQSSSKVPLQFRLDEATRRRGLQHVAELRRLLAERQASKAPNTKKPNTKKESVEPSAPRRAA